MLAKSEQNEIRTQNFFGIFSLQNLSIVKFKSLLDNEVLAYFGAEIYIFICQIFTLVILELVANLLLFSSSLLLFTLMKIPCSFCIVCNLLLLYS